MFVNSNYQAKLSPTMTENWLVQIFKNNNSSIATTDTPDLKFSFSETTYNSLQYYPAILNKPSVSYSLDLKGFTTKTGNVTLNLANIDLDGTTLLGLLGDEYINGHVNILSQIDNDNTANNALQLFSGKISSFAYRGNMIVMSIISFRPFQNVFLPIAKTGSATKEQYNNKLIPIVYGDYTANTSFTNGQDVYACPFLKNDGANFIYIVPEGTSGTDKLEFYDKGLQRFLELTETIVTPSNGIKTIHDAKTLSVPKAMKREFLMFPEDVVDDATPTPNSNSVDIIGDDVNQSGSVANIYDNNSLTDLTISTTPSVSFSSESRGFVAKLIMPQVTGKITAISLKLNGTYSVEFSSGQSGSDGPFFNVASSLIGSGAGLGFGSTSNDAVLVQNILTDQTDTALPTSTDISGVLDNNTLPANLYLSFRFNADSGNTDINSFDVVLKNLYFDITAENDLTNEPVASTTFNAGVDVVYLGRDITTPGYYQHTTATEIDELNNPVAIHRQLLYEVLGNNDLNSDTLVEDSGFKSVAELRDSNTASSTTHWQTRFNAYEQQSLEEALQKLQYEGCFFFEYSPQAQQGLSGVAPLRYFTIENSNVAAADLSQNDISDYELGITSAQDLETKFTINYKKHPAENQYLKSYDYPETYSGSNHETIFGNEKHQKQEINLDYVYNAIDYVVGNRNSSWINFRKELFGQYKTTVNATLINPEKYAMLQVGDFLDFGEITFEELGSPFNEISDTFDSFVAMPTRLFKDAWSGKKFIITNLKRTPGKVSVQCREV